MYHLSLRPHGVCVTCLLDSTVWVLLVSVSTISYVYHLSQSDYKVHVSFVSLTAQSVYHLSRLWLHSVCVNCFHNFHSVRVSLVFMTTQCMCLHDYTVHVSLVFMTTHLVSLVLMTTLCMCHLSSWLHSACVTCLHDTQCVCHLSSWLHNACVTCLHNNMVCVLLVSITT